MAPATGSSHVTRTGRKENPHDKLERIVAKVSLIQMHMHARTERHHKHALIHPADMNGATYVVEEKGREKK